MVVLAVLMGCSQPPEPVPFSEEQQVFVGNWVGHFSAGGLPWTTRGLRVTLAEDGTGSYAWQRSQVQYGHPDWKPEHQTESGHSGPVVLSEDEIRFVGVRSLGRDVVLELQSPPTLQVGTHPAALRRNPSSTPDDGEMYMTVEGHMLTLRAPGEWPGFK